VHCQFEVDISAIRKNLISDRGLLTYACISLARINSRLKSHLFISRDHVNVVSLSPKPNKFLIDLKVLPVYTEKFDDVEKIRVYQNGTFI
jgi:hypothetical protein